MDKWTGPVRTRFLGVDSAGRDVMGVVRKGLGELHHAMSFQQLNTLTRTIQIDEETAASLMITQGQAIATIFYAPVVEPVEEREEEFLVPEPVHVEAEVEPPPTVGHLILIVSSVSGAEAIAYDILTELVLFDKSTFDIIVAQVKDYLREMEHELTEEEIDALEPQQLTTQMSDSKTYDLSEGVMYQPIEIIPALYNLPSFKFQHWSGAFHHFGLPQGEQLAATWNEEEESLTLDFSVLHNPGFADYPYEEGEDEFVSESAVKGAYRMDFLYPETTDWMKRHTYYHSLFCRDVWAGWEYPEYPEGANDFTEVGIPIYPQEYVYFTGEWNSSEEKWDEWPDEVAHFWDNSFGMASNNAGSVCFETIDTYFHFPRRDFIETYSRDLRIYAKVDRDMVLSGHEDRIMVLINHERESRGLKPLVWNHVLQRAARRHADDLAENPWLTGSGYFYGHMGSDGSFVRDRAEGARYMAHWNFGKPLTEEEKEAYPWEYWAARLGENIARVPQSVIDDITRDNLADFCPANNTLEYWEETLSQPEYSSLGPAELVLATWMSSTDGHREGVLTEEAEGIEMFDFNEVTAAMTINDDGDHMAVSVFGKRYWYWPGYGAVYSEQVNGNINEYIDSNFDFEDAELFTKGFYTATPGDSLEFTKAKLLDFFLI